MNKLIETLLKVQQLESDNVEQSEIIDKIVNVEGNEDEITKLSISVGKCQINIDREDISFIDGNDRSITLSQLIDLYTTFSEENPLFINEEIQSL